MYTSTFLLALGLAGQGATAFGGSWGGAKPFSCPGNTPTTCSGDQSSGFTWGSATVGQQVSSYGGCGFSGVTCQAQGPGKKLSKRGAGFSDKCVSGKISGSASECPSMQAGHDSTTGNTMSPNSYHVSCSYDTQVDFHYQMPDGSTCMHTSPCLAAGNDVQNTQCGGAQSVTCSQSSGEKSKNNGNDCSMGIHSVGFQCGPATSIVPPQSSSTPPASHPPSSVESHPATTPVSSKPATTPATTPESSKPATTPATSPESSKPATTPATSPESSKPATTTPGPSTTPVPGSTTPVATSKPVTSGPPYQPSNSTVAVQTTPVPVSSFATTTFMTTSVVFQTTEITVTSCAPEITNCPAESKTPMVITKTVSQFTTICPVTATMVPSGNSMVPVVVSSAPAASSQPAASSAPPAQASSPSTPGTNCPDLVPSCINTLLMSIQTSCQDNSDSSCFCAVANHTQFIQDCIAAHGSDAAEVQTALTYMQGLCAPQIPQNPSIVTHQPNLQPQQPACPSGVPATTITVQVTQTPTATGSESAAVTPVVIQSTITLPQVQVTVPPSTPGATTTPAAALVPGYGATTAAPATQGPPNTTPAAVSQPAATTPAAAVTSVIPGAPVYGGFTSAASTGGVVKPTAPVSPPIATGAAGKYGVSFGAVAVAAALLI